MSLPDQTPYTSKNKIRILTSASLFDGHDAAINMMRRIIQSSGAEVIHIGHNRSAHEIVKSAIEEDVQAVAITSYQGGHNEFFKYIDDLFKKNKANIKVFGGGGGTILPSEIEDLHKYGIEKIYSPDDGRLMGLQGMINDLLMKSDFSLAIDEAEIKALLSDIEKASYSDVAKLISCIELGLIDSSSFKDKTSKTNIPVLGVTGTGGAGKSSLVDEVVRRYLRYFPEKKIAILCVDPTKKKHGGALLGDRLRMNSIYNDRVFMRSLATRKASASLSESLKDSIELCKASGFDLVLVESSGIGQSDSEIVSLVDLPLYVMTAEYGAATQLEKIDMLDFAKVIAINKFDKKESLDALRDVKKQYRRNNMDWNTEDDKLPVIGTIASQFNDGGTNNLFKILCAKLGEIGFSQFSLDDDIEVIMSEKIHIIPSKRVRYLSEIADVIDTLKEENEEQKITASKVYKIKGAIDELTNQEASGYFYTEQELENLEKKSELTSLLEAYKKHTAKLSTHSVSTLKAWREIKDSFNQDQLIYKVRNKEIKVDTYTSSLSGSKISKISLPNYSDAGDILYWMNSENLPGSFPYTAGVFPFKRQGEDPARMFAGEGNPERTNRRFHYLSADLPANRLSTAFDSVTLYGEDPDFRPDIFGKVGNSGVSICTVDDAKKLYSGFDLLDPKTSVSMTINGPSPMLLAFFLNAAIDQQCELYIKDQGLEKEVQKKIDKIYSGKERPEYEGELPKGHNGLGLMLLGVSGDQVLDSKVYEELKKKTLAGIRGTVQADILKEDQAQNTCIFSTEFALRMMGDIQEFFIDNSVTNFYSVSISGYHIAEAGANPITQLAFTLANGFTYVEYYLARGMNIDEFAPNLSFFFSNGTDPEYAVIGRVARRIWSRVIKNKYKGNSRSQKLKYHIQTSGRSLHAQEIDFNDIRTTLQALYAIFDNCNSLHTNAFDEAITTPTEDSVRRALAIQLIINKELGLTRNENPLQGSFIIEELTDLVEQAVLSEFRRICDRSGVIGAMERMYQRSKIQEESMYYEGLKHSGEMPIIGVNTFLSKTGSKTVIPDQVIRSTQEEKELVINEKKAFQKRNEARSQKTLKNLQEIALGGGNIFENLMETTKSCSLGEITEHLYEVGGQYRRNI